MNKNWLALGLFAFFFVCAVPPTLAGPFEDGVAAYNRKDYAEALRQWRPLAQQGHVKAQSMLGVVYYEGQGVPQDYGQAAFWFRKAAEQGHADAQLSLGVMYAEGQGVPKDEAQAAFWFRQAAEQGDAMAQLMLCLMYMKGQGVPKDVIEAYKWFDLAASHLPPGIFHNLVRDDLKKSMTPAQIAEAQRRASAWRPKSE